jgi:hypothetical protein
MNRKPDNSLPPPVAAHVQRQLVRHDWERLLSDLRTLCADCPADRDADICINCPLEGIAMDAATLTLRARIAKLQHKGVKRNDGHNI